MHVRGRRRRGAGERMTGLVGESSARRRGTHTDLQGLVGESSAQCRLHTERKQRFGVYPESAGSLVSKHRRVLEVPEAPVPEGQSFGGNAADGATTSRRRGACILCLSAAVPGTTTTSCTCSSCPASTTTTSPRCPCTRVHRHGRDQERLSVACCVCLLVRTFGSKSCDASCFTAVTT